VVDHGVGEAEGRRLVGLLREVEPVHEALAGVQRAHQHAQAGDGELDRGEKFQRVAHDEDTELLAPVVVRVRAPLELVLEAAGRAVCECPLSGGQRGLGGW
jgi:hypothetical protein